MSKDPTEMTEEEIRLAREFGKKEAAFLEEREKLKKVNELTGKMSSWLFTCARTHCMTCGQNFSRRLRRR